MMTIQLQPTFVAIIRIIVIVFLIIIYIYIYRERERYASAIGRLRSVSPFHPPADADSRDRIDRLEVTYGQCIYIYIYILHIYIYI